MEEYRRLPFLWQDATTPTMNPLPLPPSRRRTHVYRALAFLCSLAVFAHGTGAAEVSLGTAIVRHVPAINGGGRVEGSVQQMLGESLVLNGGATVTQDVLVPGTPTVRVNGKPSYSGTLDLDGATAPSGYQITLNGNASLRHVVRRVNPFALPSVEAPPLPRGSRSVTIHSPSGTVGDWATVRNLTLNGNVGPVAIPPGTYGDFVANGGSGFVLGIPGSAEPTVYNFQRLTLNGQTRMDVVGPVTITVAYGFSANGLLGTETDPDWLNLRVHTGSFNLNGGCSIYGYLTAPQSTVVINGQSLLEGGLICDRLIVNGGGILRLLAGAEEENQPPVAHDQLLTLPADVPSGVVLSGADPEGAPLTFTVETPPAHGVLATLGGPILNYPALDLVDGALIYTPETGYRGPDAFTFRVSDGEARSGPATIAMKVEVPPQPPEAVDDAFALNQGDTLSVAAPGVLLNDQNPSGGSY